MKGFRTIRNYICYCGIEKDEYNSIKKDAYASNFDVWRVLHFLMDAAFLFLFIYSFFNEMAAINRWFYLIGFAYSALATVCFFVLNKRSIVGQLLIYLSISMLFLFGGFITQNKPDVPAITFMAFLLIAPIFMIDKPYFMSLELVVAATVFIIWMYFVKDATIWKLDFSNTVVFTLIGIFIHIISNSIRIKEFVLIRKINIQKNTDELTGLKNKGALTREIDTFIAKGPSTKGVFFVLDIDYFKQINDTYGHDVGDRILSELGEFLRNKFVNDEIVGRFGGDEFIIFIKDTDDVKYASDIAEELSSGVSKLIKLPQEGEILSISMGIAIYRGEEKNYSEIFKKADIALYKTKANRKIKYNIYE